MPLFAVPSVKSNSLGLLAGLCAFLIWGFLVVFWHMLDAVAPFEILCYRIVFSFVSLLPVVMLTRRWAEVVSAFSQPPRGADHVRQFLCGGVELVPVHMGHQYRTDP